MSVKKQYFKTKSFCRVTFRLEKAAVGGAKQAAVAADFNHWQPERTPMKALRDGGFSVTVDLDRGREYQFRYVLDGRTWITDAAAEKYIHCSYANCQNAVVVV